MRGVERIGHLRADAQHFIDRKPALFVDQMTQGGTVDELHDDVRGAVVVAGVVGGHDVGMRELRGGGRFVAEARAGAFVGRELGAQDLHRDAARQEGVVGDPHRRHAASRQLLDEPVTTAQDPAGCGHFHDAIVTLISAPGTSARWHDPTARRARSPAAGYLRPRPIGRRAPTGVKRSPVRLGRRSLGRRSR